MVKAGSFLALKGPGNGWEKAIPCFEEDQGG